MKIIFDTYNPGDSAAGISSSTEEVTIEVKSGDPGGEPGEFQEFMRDCLRDWFDGSRVTIRGEEPQDDGGPEGDGFRYA